eukprot:TRINITY_DN20460_c0_g1_i1.p1 TRINITY_DN20460_c0_g1~~TRINITY_DN20460_c0_g1_i1.p1  ORF type:complete len:311 (-),score=62.58 TRINITY_DN20460_c0_g1_i1:145-1002(-)
MDNLLAAAVVGACMSSALAIQSLSQKQLRHSAAPSESDDAKGAISCDKLTNIPANVTALYINLDSRQDRRDKFEKGMEPFMEPFKRCKGWSLDRFSAVKAEPALLESGKEEEAESKKSKRHAGQVAAAKSHVAALKEAQGKGNGPALIFEDDFHFTGTPTSLVERLDKAFVGLKDDWDVLMLGDNSYSTTPGNLKQYDIEQTHGAWCSEAYIVNKKYEHPLLSDVEPGVALLEGGAQHVDKPVEPLGAAYDTLWHHLQKDEKSHWYIFRPKLGQQADTWGDSNID